MGLLGKTGVDEMGLLRKFVDEIGVDQMGCYQRVKVVLLSQSRMLQRNAS